MSFQCSLESSAPSPIKGTPPGSADVWGPPGEGAAGMRAGMVPFLSQSELLLCFLSQVISDCTEIFVILNQEILHFKIINEQCFQTLKVYVKKTSTYGHPNSPK